MASVRACTAANVFSTWELKPAGKYELSVVFGSSGVATGTVQRKFGSTGTEADVDSFTANYEGQITVGNSTVPLYYRAGIKTGGYTSGRITFRIS